MPEKNEQTAQELAADAAEVKPADENAEAAADAAQISEEKISRSVVNNLYREMKRWKEKCRQAESRASEERTRRREIEADADRVRGILKRIRIDDALAAAAAKHDAINPAQVAEFLRGRVALDESMEPVVLDGAGSPRLGADSSPISLDAFVHEFLSEFPHHVRPAAARGAGSAGSNGAPVNVVSRIRAAKSETELKKILAGM